MPNEETAHKLSAKEQLLLCSLLAVGYNAQRCSDIFEEQYGIEVSRQNIADNYLHDKKWKQIIKRMQREAEKKVLSHPLAKKINRLNLLKDAINEAFTWRLDKINYDKEGNELSRVEKRNIGMVAALIREARIEIEGEKGTEVKVGVAITNKVGNNGTFTGEDRDLSNRLLGLVGAKLQK